MGRRGDIAATLTARPDVPTARQHWAMTPALQSDSPATSNVIVRDYSEGDYAACRSLWAELTEYHRHIYEDPAVGGTDPGAGFDG